MDDQTQIEEVESLVADVVIEAEVEAIVEAAEAAPTEAENHSQITAATLNKSYMEALAASGGEPDITISKSIEAAKIVLAIDAQSQAAEVIPALPTIYDRIRQLRLDRAAIDRELARLSGRYRATDEQKKELGERPSWGPCTRCGHTWLGDWKPLPPVCCPQCHSAGWAIPPKNRNSRRPGDPAHPKWKKNEGVGKGKRNQHTTEYPAERPIDNVSASIMPPPPPGYSSAPPLPTPRPLADHLKELQDRGRDV